MKVILDIPPPLTTPQFMEWYELLKYSVGDRRSQVALVLSRDRLTLANWERGNHPTDWWWRGTFQTCIHYVISQLTTLLNQTTSPHERRTFENRITVIQNKLNQLSGITVHHTILPRIKPPTQTDLAVAYLRRTLKPGRWYKYSTIEEDALDEGITYRSLQRAAAQLQIDKRRKDGFQSPSYWCLPTPPSHTDD